MTASTPSQFKRVQPMRSCRLHKPPSIKKQWYEAKKQKNINTNHTIVPKKLDFNNGRNM